LVKVRIKIAISISFPRTWPGSAAF